MKPLSDKGMLVYLILIAYPSKNPALDAVVIHPAARKDYQYSVGAFNAATDEGRAYLEAVTAFYPVRLSRSPDGIRLKSLENAKKSGAAAVPERALDRGIVAVEIRIAIQDKKRIAKFGPCGANRVTTV